jgi:hypothetical protein
VEPLREWRELETVVKYAGHLNSFPSGRGGVGGEICRARRASLW